MVSGKEAYSKKNIVPELFKVIHFYPLLPDLLLQQLKHVLLSLRPHNNSKKSRSALQWDVYITISPVTGLLTGFP